jgi:hypothetical protein
MTGALNTRFVTVTLWSEALVLLGSPGTCASDANIVFGPALFFCAQNVGSGTLLGPQCHLRIEGDAVRHTQRRLPADDISSGGRARRVHVWTV